MSIKVLLKEDSVFQRNLFSEMLSTYKNIEIITVSKNLEKILDKIYTFLPHIIILDIDIIKSEELTLFEKIKKKIPLPTILLTTSEPDQADSSIKSIISKPFDIIIKPWGIWKEELPKMKN